MEMMEQPANYRLVSPHFCVAHSMDLAITKKIWQVIGNGDLVVNDVHGNLVFKVERQFFSFDRKRLILDAANVPIVTLHKNLISVYSEWKVFRGVSTEERDLIFSAKRSSIFQMKTNLHGSWFQKLCKVYFGDSSTIVAMMNENLSIGSQFSGKDIFMVKVCPNIDYAFIVALIIILDEINSEKNRRLKNRSTRAGTNQDTHQGYMLQPT
ncbi:hypothetical protein ACS0TY_020712 [Phlomoides rotata]